MEQDEVREPTNEHPRRWPPSNVQQRCDGPTVSVWPHVSADDVIRDGLRQSSTGKKRVTSDLDLGWTKARLQHAGPRERSN